MAEVLPNSLVTPSGAADMQLNGAINDSVTTITVDAVPGNLTAGDFRVRIDDEIMKVTAIAGFDLTVVREAENPAQLPKAAHADNALVYLIETGGGLVQYVSENGGGGSVERGAYASRPAAGTSGRLYLATNSPILSFDDGAAWRESYAGHPLINDTFPSTWVNQGGASIDTSKGGLTLLGTSDASVTARLLVKALPGGTPTVTVPVSAYLSYGDFNGVGLLFRESSSGKFTSVSLAHHSTAYNIRAIYTSKWTSPTVYASDEAGFARQWWDLAWLRAHYDGTNMVFSWSPEPNTVPFEQVNSIPIAAWMTPDQWGVYSFSQNSRPVSARFWGWDES